MYCTVRKTVCLHGFSPSSVSWSASSLQSQVVSVGHVIHGLSSFGLAELFVFSNKEQSQSKLDLAKETASSSLLG